jgi:protein-S-isoprenylcysteine O-methyltransferase Ste14
VRLVRFFDWFLLAALVWLLCLGIIRMMALRARGIRVVVIERNRTVAQDLLDRVQVLSLLFLAYEVVAYAWPLPAQLVPPWLDTILVDTRGADVVGAIIVLTGIVIYWLALRAFGESWRLGIDRDKPGELVTDGIFTWSRNPVYLALDLFAIGVFFILGRLIFLILALANVGMFHLLIRREERSLMQVYGDAYHDYCARVGRYFTLHSTRDDRSGSL